MTNDRRRLLRLQQLAVRCRDSPHIHFTVYQDAPAFFLTLISRGCSRRSCPLMHICLCCIKDVSQRRSRCVLADLSLSLHSHPLDRQRKKVWGVGGGSASVTSHFCPTTATNSAPPPLSHICPFVRLFSLFYDCAVAALVTSPWQPPVSTLSAAHFKVCVFVCVCVVHCDAPPPPKIPLLRVCWSVFVLSSVVLVCLKSDGESS